METTSAATILPPHAAAPSSKSPEFEAETPKLPQPPPPQQPKVIPFNNGVLRRHPFQHHHIPIVVSYKECLKNHAATMGGHALDGCGEFLPSPYATHTDPTSLKCAACGCHRNFHRRESDDHYGGGSPPQPPTPTILPSMEYQPHHRHHPPPPSAANQTPSSSPPPISSSFFPSAPHMLLALSAGGEHVKLNGAANSSPRKRFRTKFTSAQKDKMFTFAEEVGWKMQKRDEEMIQRFCNEIRVEKSVLKVWMHNNKNTFGKRVAFDGAVSSPPPAGGSPIPGVAIQEDVDEEEDPSIEQQQQQQELPFVPGSAVNGGPHSP